MHIEGDIFKKLIFKVVLGERMFQYVVNTVHFTFKLSKKGDRIHNSPTGFWHRNNDGNIVDKY